MQLTIPIKLFVKSPFLAPPTPPSGVSQSKKILLNLSIKCWNSAFNAQGERVVIVLVQVEKWKYMKQQWRRCSGKRKGGMKLNLRPKLVENQVWVPVISFCKISLSVTHLMAYYVETGCSRPVNFCIVNHDISSGWQLWWFSELFLVFRTCLFLFLYLTPMSEAI